jgi:hypothetical protein
MKRTKGSIGRLITLGLLLGVLAPAAQTAELRAAGSVPDMGGSPRSTNRITLEASVACFHDPAPNTITVNIWVHDLSQVIQGGQFFLGYDNTVLDFVSANPAPTVFTLQVYKGVDEAAGTIDYATAVPLGPPNPLLYPNHTMAVLKFRLMPGQLVVCDVANLVWFRPHFPPTCLTTTANPLIVATLALGGITVDNIPPAINPLASNQSVECDGAGNTVQFNVWLNDQTGAVAADACGPVVWSNDYNIGHWVVGAGVTYVPVTFTATDRCGNVSMTTAVFTIEDATLGDLDCDCALTVADLGPFVEALTDPVTYAAAHSTCNIHLGDMNGDTFVDGADIQGFVTALLSGG